MIPHNLIQSSNDNNSPDGIGGGDEDDDDDFKKNNDYEKMCLDQLLEGASVGGAGYDDNDPLEEDDEVRDDLGEDPEDDLMIDEEDENENGVTGERTTKSENQTAIKRKDFSESDNSNGLRIQKKQTATTALTSASTQKKKPGSKSSSKKPACYNEGAEESKGWMAEE
jgi:hypothetical protein